MKVIYEKWHLQNLLLSAIVRGVNFFSKFILAIAATSSTSTGNQSTECVNRGLEHQQTVSCQWVNLKKRSAQTEG